MGTSLAVHWLRLLASIAGVMGSIPDWRTSIPQAEWHGLKKKKRTVKSCICGLEQYPLAGIPHFSLLQVLGSH